MPLAMNNCAQKIETDAQFISILFWPSQHTLVILSTLILIIINLVIRFNTENPTMIEGN